VFDPPPDGWDDIEAPYQRQFSDAERDSIVAIVNRYLDERRFEQAAVLSRNKIDLIDKTLQAAKQLNGTLNRLTRRDMPDRNARLDAVLDIEQEWPGGGGTDHFRKLLILSHALALACIQAKKKAESDTGMKIGRAWDQMVRELASFVREIGLKASASKGLRGGGFKPSPFVLFIKAIESQCPSSIPTRSYTDQGLTDAISDILSESRKRANRELTPSGFVVFSKRIDSQYSSDKPSRPPKLNLSHSLPSLKTGKMGPVSTAKFPPSNTRLSVASCACKRQQAGTDEQTSPKPP
jgi:hypothetical protein